MTLFDSLFRMPSVCRRHNSAPLLNERVAFLMDMQRHDRKFNTLRAMASHLLQINRTLGFKRRMRILTMEELKRAGRNWADYVGPMRRRVPGKCSYELYMRIARGWLRFHSCLAEFRKSRISEARLRDFEQAMREHFALASSTIETRSRHASYFLDWISRRNVKLQNLSVQHVERYLDNKRAEGWALSTRATAAYSIEVFLRHAERRRWVRPGLSQGVPTYAIPQYDFVCRGPSWVDVQRMIASLHDKDPLELRDHAMVLLMALYGFRVSDVVALQLSDLDLPNRILTITRRKTHTTQRFPLNSETFATLRKYLSRARPISDCPAVFTTFVAPYEPLRRGTIYSRTRLLFDRNSVESRCRGPHALRHACADRLMKKGVLLRDLAAFMAHANTRAVRAYARYDMAALREIADFSLEGML